VTDLALLDFEPQTKQMRLRQVQPGVSVAAVQEATGFPLLLGEDITELPEPSATEIEMLRELSGGGGGTP
jgi:glutaconate CoA-transferase, subunit B